MALSNRVHATIKARDQMIKLHRHAAEAVTDAASTVTRDEEFHYI